jgi:hypothetical protein
MLQITEDTPPDMLAGAMDLTVHLPTGRSVKMSVERSTPMMDLLVQVTTNYHLQLSRYTLQALGMAPSNEHSDTILPYKPNTPIGALETQHIKVIPKSKTVSVPKNVPAGHQPFESTFRLKIHLPRNQLYVTRVSQNVHLEGIMKKVCEEKNLDSLKYEFRHPANLDEILDPKLTLSDYAITEIHLVQKGTGSLNQTFSTGDIMALRKEEERKQIHSKTGGGVFNLIFRRGKSSTGSLSSENRSISPTHSDDSRSVTPPGVQQRITTPPQSDPLQERPKPPQRKRRPAPKPPQEKLPNYEASTNIDSGLTICHSRNSSDSSGYHEASILSDNCNTSLPRRPKSTVISDETQKSLSGLHSQSTSNLNKMSVYSKSTSSLAFPSRKKKTAPPPPVPVLKLENPDTNFQEPSPVVVSQPCIVAQTESRGNGQDTVVVNNTNPTPIPRIRTKTTPSPRPRSSLSVDTEGRSVTEKKIGTTDLKEKDEIVSKEIEIDSVSNDEIRMKSDSKIHTSSSDIASEEDKSNKQIGSEKNHRKSDDLIEKESHENKAKNIDEKLKRKVADLAQLQKESVSSIFNTTNFVTPHDKVKPPEIVALHPKEMKQDSYPKSVFESNKKSFQIGSSLLDLRPEEETKKISSDLSTPNSVASALNAFDFVDEIEGVDVEMFTGSLSKNSKNKNVILNQLHGMHEFETLKKNPSGGSLRSVSSLPGFVGSNMKKWNNIEELDVISLNSCGGRNGWVIGDTSDTESTVSTMNTTQHTPLDSLTSVQSLSSINIEQKPKEVIIPIKIEEKNTEPEPVKENELETDWQYQLPSPPKAFRDSSPIVFTDIHHESIADSVVTSPELFEKLKEVKDVQSEKETVSDLTSTMSEEEKPLLNKLSLENLEKRKSLVYNRELATSLKMSEEDKKNNTFSSSLMNFEKTYDEMKRSSPRQMMSTTTSTLPNFKITTYNNSKQKLEIFEDDTVRSNTDRSSKRNSFAEPTFLPQNTHIGRSMENLSFKKNRSRKNSEEGSSINDYHFYKPSASKNHLNMGRSESFSKEQTWVPSKPVMRSKSQVALNRYKDNKHLEQENDDNLTKSNSLFDVSGLQSLGVMRLIQNRLNTPNNSTEELDRDAASYQEQPEIKHEVQNQVEENKPVKTNKYTLPSINMSTWSERPKIPVNVKEDPDYKYSVRDSNNSKIIVNTFNNDIKSSNSIEVNNKIPHTYTNGVSVRVDSDHSKNYYGSEPVSNNTSGNVVIKIAGTKTASAKPFFRKPLGNVNTEINHRPHSIAFGSDFDISRVPIVRSVEFKKPYKDLHSNNTTITHIYPNGNSKSTTWVRNGTNDAHQTSEAHPTKSKIEAKPVFRVNSYLQNSSAPVVRGFSSGNEVNRMSWGQPHSFSTLPTKTAAKVFSTNNSVPFSQVNLRRTESTKIETSAKNTQVPPAPGTSVKNTQVPPPPVMPKVVNRGKVKSCDNYGGDPKEQLLQAIRDFGGKKGLRAVKA